MSDKKITITQLRIKNFKCFRDIAIPLRPLTIIYGQNSSGKSTIFQAIDLMRIACWQLKVKEEEWSKPQPSNKPVPANKNNPTDLKKVPWYPSWESILNVTGEPIKVGLTLQIKADESHAPAAFIAVDFTLNKDWDAHGQGGKLPQEVRFRYWLPELTKMRNDMDDAPDIDLSIRTKFSEDARANRQYAYMTVGSTQKDVWVQKYTANNCSELAKALEKPNILLGDCPFFKELSSTKSFMNGVPGIHGVFDSLNKYLKHSWERLHDVLTPEQLYRPDIVDLRHIPADQVYLTESEHNRGKAGSPTLMLRRDISSLLAAKQSMDSAESGDGSVIKDMPLYTMGQSGKTLIEQLNADLHDFLNIPHEIDEERGITDTRRPTLGTGLSFSNIGYGMQYLIPRLLLLIASNDGFSCIEEPEAHVHPALQSRLGSYFLHHVDRLGGQRLVESHSENLILKIKKEINEVSRTSSDEAKRLSEKVLALYVDTVDTTSDHGFSNETEISLIRIDSEGDFRDYWPKGFFPERNALYY